MIERVSLEDCYVVNTPLGLGVCVGNVVWTQFGPGSFSVDAREHQARLEELVARAGKGETILMAPFVLHPPAGQKFSILVKDRP